MGSPQMNWVAQRSCEIFGDSWYSEKLFNLEALLKVIFWYISLLGNSNTVKLLLENGANANLLNNFGKTALDIAMEKGKIINFFQPKRNFINFFHY